MPWQCKMVDSMNNAKHIGDMFYIPYEEGKGCTQYERDWKGRRDFLYVRLPNGDLFSPDRPATDSIHGWTVTGEAPYITISPSINVVIQNHHKDGYHGWLQNGILSDDIEGRNYKERK